MSALAGIDMLSCIYFFLFTLGVGYALIAVVFGEISHFDIPGLDIDIPGLDLHPGGPDIHLEIPFHHDISHDVDHPEVGLSPLSPITIATFVTTFGGTGLILRALLSLHPALELLGSTVSGLALSGVVFLLYGRVLMGMQGSSEAQAGELVGRFAETTTPIPVGQVGEIALIVRGARTRHPARSVEGRDIPRGAVVEVVEETGSVVLVRAKEAHTAE